MEDNYDYVKIGQCSDASCERPTYILEKSGSLVPTDVYTSSTGFLKVTFTSDGAVEYSGFTAKWKVVGLERTACDNCPSNSTHTITGQTTVALVFVTKGSRDQTLARAHLAWRGRTRLLLALSYAPTALPAST